MFHNTEVWKGVTFRLLGRRYSHGGVMFQHCSCVHPSRHPSITLNVCSNSMGTAESYLQSGCRESPETEKGCLFPPFADLRVNFLPALVSRWDCHSDSADFTAAQRLLRKIGQDTLNVGLCFMFEIIFCCFCFSVWHHSVQLQYGLRQVGFLACLLSVLRKF